MAIAFVGYGAGRDPRVTSLSGGLASTASNGDYMIWWIGYPNTMTAALASTTGWTRLRKTVGTAATVELWWRIWHTGDPTSWTCNVTGFSPSHRDNALTMVFRGLVAAPTVVSATHETSSSPAQADAVTDSSIGNNDFALYCFATENGTFDGTTTPTLASNTISGTSAGVSVGWLVTGTTGTSASLTASCTGTDLFGLQTILPDVPTVPPGGWGVGQIRMNH